MAISKLTIVNAALHLVGAVRLTQAQLDAELRKSAIAAADLYEIARNEMFDLAVDWKFATTRVELDMIYLLTIDTAPTPTTFAAGATLTGQTSGETCTILAKVTDTTYLIYNQSDDFTDGEVLTDDADTPNSVDCATDYPTVAAHAPVCGYDYQYRYPTGWRRTIATVDEGGDKIEYDSRRELLVEPADNEIDVLLTNQSEVFIKYIYLRTSEAIWPAWFVKLVYMNLALLLCEPLKQDKQKKNQLLLMFEEAFIAAIKSNGLSDMDVSDENVSIDRGNTDVVNASSIEEITKKYIVVRE